MIVVQAMIFTAMTTADRAAGITLAAWGFDCGRCRSPRWCRSARACCRRSLGGGRLAAAIAVGFGFGFRFSGWVHTAAFVGIALVLSLALSLGADAMGSVASSVEAAGQTLLVPQLLLVMLSTGIAPAQAFPDWLGPFVRNQPVSQIAARCVSWLPARSRPKRW